MNEIYTTSIFDEWLSTLKDKVAQAAIRKRIHKAELGNFGTVRFLRDGLWEMKIDISGGYRLYSQTTSKLKCVGSPCRIIYTVFGKPPVSLLKLFDYITNRQAKSCI